MAIRPRLQQKIPAMYDICAIGNAMVDIIAECDDAFLEKLMITKGAMTLIDDQRASFLYGHIGPSIEMSGGSAANTAVGVAKLGGKPAYIGKVRADQFGLVFAHDMRASQVHFPTQAAQEGPTTGISLILVTPDAQRSMNTYLGICTEFSKEDIDRPTVANAQVTYLEGYLYDKPKAQEAFHVAAKLSHEAGRQIAMTLSDTFCVDRHREAFLPFVRDWVDILIGNEYELMSLYQVATFEEAMAQAKAQCSLVVGTRSEKGAVVICGDQIAEIMAAPVEVVVDSTGAGDLFAAGFLYGYSHDYDLVTCGKMGAIAAAEVIGHYGPRPQHDLKELVRAQGIEI